MSPINGNGIATRAMLVRFSVTAWTARKFERKASDQVAKAVNATQDAGRYNKHLLAGAKAHADIIKAAGHARDVHYKNTLPWADEGDRLLTTTNYLAYADAMRAAKSQWESAVEIFMDEYPTLQIEAEGKLGDLYRKDEYPKAWKVRRLFTWSIDFSPLPADGDLRLDLPADVKAQIEANVSDMLQQKTADAMHDAWRRLYESVERIKMRAGDEASPLRATLITQAMDVVDVLGRLNVTGDSALDAMRDRALRELTAFDVEILRNDPDLRKQTAEKADAILAAMTPFYAPAPEQAA